VTTTEKLRTFEFPLSADNAQSNINMMNNCANCGSEGHTIQPAAIIPYVAVLGRHGVDTRPGKPDTFALPIGGHPPQDDDPVHRRLREQKFLQLGWTEDVSFQLANIVGYMLFGCWGSANSDGDRECLQNSSGQKCEVHVETQQSLYVFINGCTGRGRISFHRPGGDIREPIGFFRIRGMHTFRRP